MKLTLSVIGLVIAAFLGGGLCSGQSIPPANEGGIGQGKALFRSNCAFCHGLTAKGGRGPNLISSTLLASGSEDSIKAVIRSGVAGTTMPGFDLPKDDLETLLQYLHSLTSARVAGENLPGDPKAGELVYSRSGCGNCHRVGETGSIYGPELTRIGAGRSLEYLRESLVDPSADIPDNYGGVTVVTKDGKRVSGVRINEDTFSVQLRKSDQHFALFDKTEVKEVIHETKSMMPAYNQLSQTDLQNLVAYLSTLRGAQAAGAEANKAGGIR